MVDVSRSGPLSIRGHHLGTCELNTVVGTYWNRSDCLCVKYCAQNLVLQCLWMSVTCVDSNCPSHVITKNCHVSWRDLYCICRFSVDYVCTKCKCSLYSQNSHTCQFSYQLFLGLALECAWMHLNVIFIRSMQALRISIWWQTCCISCELNVTTNVGGIRLLQYSATRCLTYWNARMTEGVASTAVWLG